MTRHVRTEAGVKKYGLPIGSPIVAGAGKAKKSAKAALNATRADASAPVGPRPGSAAAAFSRSAGVARLHAATRRPIAHPPPGPAATPKPSGTPRQRIARAFDAIMKANGGYDRPGYEWVGLAQIREHPELAGLSRAEVDRALEDMLHSPAGRNQDLRIIPVANSKSLTQADRDAALRLGGTEHHAMMMNRRAVRQLGQAGEPASPKPGTAKARLSADRPRRMPGTLTVKQRTAVIAELERQIAGLDRRENPERLQRLLDEARAGTLRQSAIEDLLSFDAFYRVAAGVGLPSGPPEAADVPALRAVLDAAKATAAAPRKRSAKNTLRG